MTMEIVDLFCGAGGTSTGILKAVARLNKKARLTAVNHWKTAVNTHSLNHPTVKHICEPVENLHPLDLIKSGNLHTLAASCECRFHSNARGGGPCNEQSRSQPWQIIRWATDIHVENILMENVREFMNWGPLHPRTKRPIKSRKGEYFRAFINAILGLGYKVEFKVQVAADFGDPTSRPRLILLARKSNPIKWPEPSHGPGRALPWRTARECIDWELKGKSIFDRKKPLCKNTLRRIAAGLAKFGGPNAEPFLVLLRGTSDGQINGSARSLDEPLPTLTAGGGHLVMCEPFVIGQQSGAVPRGTNEPLPTVACAGAIRLVEPFIHAYHNGHDSERRTHSVDDPLPTQDTSNRFALIEPFIQHLTHHGSDNNRCHSVDKPMPTVTGAHRGEMALVEPIIVQTDQTGGNGLCSRSVDTPLASVVSKQNMLLVEPFVIKYYGKGFNAESLQEPLASVTTKQRFCLVECNTGRTVAELDIRTRMLQPHELSLAHSFPRDYKFTGNKEDQTKQIGNSVPVELAAAHAASLFAE
jgi:DNA (cytosine-5)-methyltransferase 1